MKIINEPTFSTKDLGVASYLATTEHELTGTTLEDPKKVIFHFRRKEETENLVVKYLSGTAQASAKKLFENYRTLRGLVYSRINNVR